MSMHAGEVVADEEVVRHLLHTQHPDLAQLPLRPLPRLGTDHVLFRLGEDLVVRMPVYAASADQAVSDARWLPVLAPHLPVAVPAPVALGEPDDRFPFAWSVAPWLPGTNPVEGALDRPDELADDLAAFVRALHGIDPAGGPRKTGTGRGVPLERWDDAVRDAIERSTSLPGRPLDVPAVTAAWEDCLAAPDWPGPPTWLHGDLLPGNLLVRDGRLSAVIDFGALGLGDPSPDLQPAWTVLPASARERFRRAVGYDDDTWRRGRGWALGPAVTGIPYYWDTAPAFARRGLRTVAAVLAAEVG